jgi:CheY-like chemotaxis protein
MKTAILCVDDDKLVLDSLRIQLNRHFKDRYLLEFAQDAMEGLEVIDHLSKVGIQTILVISDWMMPGMYGDEFLHWIKERYPRMNTMILTGQADDKRLAQLQELGVTNCILTKPWSEAELVGRIDIMLS